MNERRSLRVTTRQRARFVLLCLICVAPIGCSAQRAGPFPAPPVADNTPITLTPVDRASHDAVIAKFGGKVVLVDYWATWCQPCVEKLPHTLELGQRLAASGLAVVTVSCDDPADSGRVAEFLSTQHASGATNLISQFGGSPRTMEEFEIANGSVPFYKLYDRKGQLRQTFGVDPAVKKQFTSADIEAAVERLLAEKE
jgi:thiol-disulfide isomerase/thioredoxin